MTTQLLDRPAGVSEAEWAEIVDALTRREFLGAGLAGAALVGMGLAGFDTGAAAAAGATRKVAGAYGAVELPVAPRRVIALSKAAVATMLDVGLTPIGTDQDEAASAIPAYQKRISAIPTVGTYGQFNVEAMAALRPDLVMSYDTYLPHPLYSKVTRVAPTFALDTGGTGNISWQATTAAFANALNRNQQLDTLKKRYTTRLASIRQKYAHTLAANVWEVTQAATAGTFYRYLPSSDTSAILSAVGATLGNARAKGANYWGPELSYETIGPQLRHATVILCVQVGSGPLVSQKLWKDLPAARTGHVFESNLFFPAGYSGGLALLDLIADICERLEKGKR